jgi:hypothetical protein
MIEAVTTIHRDIELVASVGTDIYSRYGADALGQGFADAVRAQAAKRVALQFSAERIASWDHRKLSGIY